MLRSVEIFFHPLFARQIEQMAKEAEHDEALTEIFGDVSALLQALEEFGHEIEGDQPEDASHRIVTSRYELFALRRTPPTAYTPYAQDRPVIRIVYAWCEESAGSEGAVVMLMGDKAQLGNTWYDRVVRQVEDTMIREWEQRHPRRRIRRRRR